MGNVDNLLWWTMSIDGHAPSPAYFHTYNVLWFIKQWNILCRSNAIYSMSCPRIAELINYNQPWPTPQYIFTKSTLNAIWINKLQPPCAENSQLSVSSLEFFVLYWNQVTVIFLYAGHLYFLLWSHRYEMSAWCIVMSSNRCMVRV